jgi:SAM-dependent methyltransferase
VKVSGGDLFLPLGYNENLPEPVGTEEGIDFWAREAETRTRRARRYQDPVYRFAARLAGRDAVVLDVGCGAGDNLVQRIDGRVARAVGVDQPSAIEIARRDFPDHEWVAADLRDDDLWDALVALRPDLTICADVIEHVDDPCGFLARLRRVIGAEGTLVLSTPDRDRVEHQPALGPPRNPHHIREWTRPEMTQLLTASGFDILSFRHLLPRHYDFNVLEAKMFAWRMLRFRAVPGRRSSMVFELASA